MQLGAAQVNQVFTTVGTENPHPIPGTAVLQLFDILFLLAKRSGTLGTIVRIAFFAVRPTLGRFSSYDSTFCTLRLWQDSITPICAPSDEMDRNQVRSGNYCNRGHWQSHNTRKSGPSIDDPFQIPYSPPSA